MNTIIERVGGGPVSLDAFADEHRLIMRVTERAVDSGLPRYLARFEHVEISRHGLLIGEFGNGETPAEAIQNYAHLIRGQRLVFGAYGPDRKTFTAPNEWLVKEKA